MPKKADAAPVIEPGEKKDEDEQKLELIGKAGEAGLAVAADNLPVHAQPKWLNLVMQKQIKDELAKDATMGEFGMFIYRCARLGLDPMLRQAYLVPFGKGDEDEDGLGTRTKKHAMIVGIDGFRAKTREQGLYSSVTEWCGPDEVWKNVWLKKHEILDPGSGSAPDAKIIVPSPPSAARVGLKFEGQADYTYGLALYDEFCVMIKSKKLKAKVPGPMWMKSPSNQLAKCAEAQGHRKLNGSLLSGVYIREEMEHMLLGTGAVNEKAGLIAAAEAGSSEAANSLASMGTQGESGVLAEWATKLATCKTREDYKKLWDKEGALFTDTATMRAAHVALGEHRTKTLGGK